MYPFEYKTIYICQTNCIMAQKPYNNYIPIFTNPAIYTDYYELIMAQGYFLSGRKDERATFDYYFRNLPFKGGYVVFAGINDLLEIFQDYKFHPDELIFLENLGFQATFLDYLSNLKLNLDIYSAKEGEIVFPNTLSVRVDGPLIEAQLIETILLNIINFESLIATKATRMVDIAGHRQILDFGLRRAQGLGGIQASKGAAIGGISGTSNVYASFVHGTTVSGTMAHAWIQSFESELEAFRKFVEFYPDSAVLLVDTFDTLKSGIPNSIKVAKELEAKGHKLKGIRLDSGDLAYLSRKSREMLDAADLQYVKIAASNQLDEWVIQSLQNQQAPIDLYGVGTNLVTAKDSPALDGVYKLSSVHGTPKMKMSENKSKATLPGIKKVHRFLDKHGMMYCDGILFEEELNISKIYHPLYPEKNSSVEGLDYYPLLQSVMKNGVLTQPIPSTKESADYAKAQLKKLQPEHKRLENPHIYKVGVSEQVLQLRDLLSNSFKVQP